MKTKEITVDQVRSELERLISDYPDRKGSLDDKYSTCLYYTDGNGDPIQNYFEEAYEEPLPVLTNPVCIVAAWIEEFHPEFKDNEVIREVLFSNEKISTIREKGSLSDDVINVLDYAQSIQDDGIHSWGDINFDFLA